MARTVAHAAALGFVAYLLALIVARPWHRDWGSTAAERRESLPGDEHAGNPARAGDRAITIDAPAADVWPWLVQMGEDRGGFYSYASLENLFGLHIVNAERIVPAWQRLVPGDLVRGAADMAGAARSGRASAGTSTTSTPRAACWRCGTGSSKSSPSARA